MAAYSITVANRLSVFGAAPSDKWGSYAWNAFKWGDGTADLGTRVVKLVANAMAVSSDSAMAFRFVKRLLNDVVMTGDMGSEQLRDGEGYLYVFPDRTTEGESRATVTWTQGSAQTSSYSASAVVLTTWS